MATNCRLLVVKIAIALHIIFGIFVEESICCHKDDWNTGNENQSENTTLLVVGSTMNIPTNAGKIEVYDEYSKSWRLYHDIGNDIQGYAAVILDDELLRICGHRDYKYFNSVDSLNLRTLKTSKRPSASVGRTRFTANVIDGNVYIAGGWIGKDCIDSLEVWNPLLKNWITLSPMKEKRHGHTAVVYDKKLYVFGGWNYDKEYMDTAEYYDPQKYAWFSIAKMNQPLVDSASAVIGDKIYVMAGQTVDNEIIDKMNVYHPVTDTWTTSTHIPVAVKRLASVAMNNKIYISGGEQKDGASNDVYEFDPITEKWRSHSLHVYSKYLHSLLVVSKNSINP